MRTIRTVLITMLLAAGLSCVLHASDCTGQNDNCQGEDGCETCVVCQAGLIIQDQPALEQIPIVQFLAPVADLLPPAAFVEVPFQPPRV